MSENKLDDEEEIRKIITEYGNAILRLAYAYVFSLNEAEDILQDVLIKYLHKKPIFADDNHLKAWLLRITINLSKNKLRSFWFKFDGLKDEEISANVTNDTSSTNDDLMDALKKLPSKYKEVIHLYYFEEYKTSEIALILDTNESTIRSLLKRGREKLKIILKEELELDE